MTGHKVIFKTAKSWELIMVTNLLREREIPFTEREEKASGPEAASATSGQSSWSVLVPPEFEKKARKTLNELPINMRSHAPDIWDSGADDEAKRNWQIFAWISIIVIVLAIIITFLQR